MQIKAGCWRGPDNNSCSPHVGSYHPWLCCNTTKLSQCLLLCNFPVTQIKAGRWHGPEGKSQHVTQYHDVIGDNLGAWARIVVQVRAAVLALWLATFETGGGSLNALQQNGRRCGIALTMNPNTQNTCSAGVL
jgi:hypothetical protein